MTEVTSLFSLEFSLKDTLLDYSEGSSVENKLVTFVIIPGGSTQNVLIEANRANGTPRAYNSRPVIRTTRYGRVTILTIYQYSKSKARYIGMIEDRDAEAAI
ncbi:hypothetical protein N7456_012615 [Penicillium angulare]|uniref:Uncharacterized protein n=1 Tax=Penicillium angulare TaxID=116970 RepID=A0A9W9JVK9_9EURO|nr:hypothetical protein N7456_012615 [Penicillium angulare]